MMMTNQENRTSGSPEPGHEHHPTPRHEHQQHTAIVAASHSEGGARDRSTAGDSNRLATDVIARTAEMAGQAGEQLNRLMTAQKNLAASGLYRLACALRDTTQKREPDEVPSRIATYGDRAATRMESMSTYMRETEFPAMLRDAGQLARRRPELLFAGTVLTGLLVARLLEGSRRASAQPLASATGRLHAALQKGTQAVSAAADTLKHGAEAQYGAIAENSRRATEKLTGRKPTTLYRRMARWSRRQIA
jgi:hypothetical protein